MNNEARTYYALKGIASASVAILAGFIGFFSSKLFTGTDSLPLLAVLLGSLIVVVAKAAEARLDDKMKNEGGLDDSDYNSLILTILIMIYIITPIFAYGWTQ